MTQIEQIKAEIERRIEQISKTPEDNETLNAVLGGQAHELMTLLSYIKSLPQEQPQGLDEAATIMADECLQGLPISGELLPSLKEVVKIAVKHGAKWMTKQGVEGYVVESASPVCTPEHPQQVITLLYDLNATNYVKAGDKVIVQIRKKED